MPVGVDPRLNQTEQDWGILYDQTKGFCKYEKGDSQSRLRYCSQGTELIVESFVPLDEPFDWNGVTIRTLAQGVSVDYIKSGPVYLHLNRVLQNLYFAGGPQKPSAKSVPEIQNELSADQDDRGTPIDGSKFNSVY